MWHPWRAIRNLPVEVVWTELPDNLAAETDGRTIWIDRRLTQAQRRSTIEHERQHLLAGHGDECSPRLEARVEEAAARQLISLHRLAAAIVWSQDERDLADELWVDIDMVRARLSTLRDDERDHIESVIARREGAL